MYSPRIVEERLDFFAASNGWMPCPHSYQEVLEFTSYIKSLVKLGSNSKGAWIEGLNFAITDKRRKEIYRWIENEQIMCSLSYAYWRDNYAWVVDEGGQEVKFKNRKSQDVFDSVVAALEEEQAGIQILTLKARQVGITTLVSLYFNHKMLFIPNTLSVMASVQKSKSDEIEIKFNTAYDKCPFWLIPPRMPKS